VRAACLKQEVGSPVLLSLLNREQLLFALQAFLAARAADLLVPFKKTTAIALLTENNQDRFGYNQIRGDPRVVSVDGLKAGLGMPKTTYG
jgi:hypothetical protein